MEEEGTISHGIENRVHDQLRGIQRVAESTRCATNRVSTTIKNLNLGTRTTSLAVVPVPCDNLAERSRLHCQDSFEEYLLASVESGIGHESRERRN